jgi:hypothetical protein
MTDRYNFRNKRLRKGTEPVLTALTRPQTHELTEPDPKHPQAVLFHMFPVLTDKEITRGIKLGHGYYRAAVWTDAEHNVVHCKLTHVYSAAPKRAKGDLLDRIHQTAREMSEAHRKQPVDNPQKIR